MHRAVLRLELESGRVYMAEWGESRRRGCHRESPRVRGNSSPLSYYLTLSYYYTQKLWLCVEGCVVE